MDNSLPHILIVDDDAGLLVTLNDILKMKGFEPICVQTGNAALTQLENREFDVALIDLRLASHNMSGLDVMSAIKTRTPETECILLTGHATQDSAISAIQMNAFGYFQKPLNMEQVLLSVQRAVEKRRSARALRESQELFMLFMHYSPIYTYIKEVTPTESRILQASDNFIELTGIEGRYMTGKAAEELFPPEFAAKITADDWSVITNGKVLKLEENFNDHHYTTIKFPIVQGNKTLLAGYTIDTTEQVQARDELRRAKEALEEANLALQTALTREQQLAHTDALTGINNRRSLYELAEREFAIAERYQQPLSVIMFDIDHFKEVNDTFGHAVGDQILQRVVQVTCKELRSVDVVGRYGGEEFVIILPMTNAHQAFPLAERIREKVAAICLPTENGNATVTLSIGIAEILHGAYGGSAESLIRNADKMMYVAKQAGRNRTEIGS